MSSTQTSRVSGGTKEGGPEPGQERERQRERERRRRSGQRATPGQLWVLGLSSVASFMVILDMLVVTTALTSIQHDLHASMADLEWTVNAYTLSFAVLLMTSASLGDRYGQRRLFAAGLALFTLASAACALSPGVGFLIAARAVQGAGAATVMPLALGVLNAAFPPERRGWALGVYGSVTGLAVMSGPVLGGVLTQGLAWQWIFWLNVPVGLAAIPLVLTRTKERYGNGTALDLPGLLLFTLASVGLVWALVRSGDAGWGSAEIVGSLIAGAVLLAAFVAWQARTDTPMLPLRLFRSRPFATGNAVIFILNASMTGVIFFLTQYQQVGLHQGPLEAGVRLLPWGVGPFLVAPRAGALADRVGERPLVVAGLALNAGSMAWLAAVATDHTSYAAEVAPILISGIGLSLALPALTKAVVSTSAPADIGKASGAFSTMRQLGGAFGVAIPATVFAAAGSYASASAFTDGFRSAMGVIAGLAFLGTATALLLPKHRRA